MATTGAEEEDEAEGVEETNAEAGCGEAVIGAAGEAGVSEEDEEETAAVDIGAGCL